MENSNLRSLEARDRPLGTERPVLLPGTHPKEPAADFSVDVDRARTRRREETERSERTDERRSSGRDEAADRAREAREAREREEAREPRREEPVRATDDVAAEPVLVDPLTIAAQTTADLDADESELPEAPTEGTDGAGPLEAAAAETLPRDTATVQQPDAVKNGGAGAD